MSRLPVTVTKTFEKLFNPNTIILNIQPYKKTSGPAIQSTTVKVRVILLLGFVNI